MTDGASPQRGVVEHDFDATLFTIRVASGNCRVGVGIRTAAVHHSERVACSQGFHELHASREVERLTIERDDEITAPDRGGLEAVSTQRARLDCNDDYTFYVLAQAQACVRGLLAGPSGGKSFGSRGWLDAQPIPFEAHA